MTEKATLLQVAKVLGDLDGWEATNLGSLMVILIVNDSCQASPGLIHLVRKDCLTIFVQFTHGWKEWFLLVNQAHHGIVIQPAKRVELQYELLVAIITVPGALAIVAVLYMMYGKPKKKTNYV